MVSSIDVVTRLEKDGSRMGCISFQLSRNISIYEKKVKTFLRFIYDFLMIGTGSEVGLQKFINKLNKKYRIIKFEF